MTAPRAVSEEDLLSWSPPAWLGELLRRYNAGVSNQFVLHGNVDDLIDVGGEYVRLRELLIRLTARRRILIFANLSAGLDALRGAGPFLAALLGGPPESLSDQEARERLRKLPRDPSAMLEALDRVFRSDALGRRDMAVVFDYAAGIVPAGTGTGPSRADRGAAMTLHRWGNDQLLLENRPLIVLVERRLSDLNRDAFEGNGAVTIIDVPLPSETDRRRYIEFFGRTRTPPGWTSRRAGLSPAAVARLSGGLTLAQIEDILLETWAGGLPLTEEDILDRKVEILHEAYGDILEVVRPKHGLEAVGGMEYVTSYLAEVAELMRRGERKHVPMGILLMGPPGTGKTFVVTCFAKTCGLLVVKAKTLRAKYVGESERNQERFFAVIEALAPVVVIVDESEQQAGGRDPDRADHPVDARMRAQAFQFWGDSSHRGSILRIDITNWPRLMDPAMLRSGRTDTKIPLLYPDATGREAILAALCRRHGLRLEEGVDLAAVARRTEGFSPADLEQVVLLADRFAALTRMNAGGQHEPGVGAADIEAALEDFRLPRRDRRRIDRMTLEALEECSRRSLMPPGGEALIDELRRALGEDRP